MPTRCCRRSEPRSKRRDGNGGRAGGPSAGAPPVSAPPPAAGRPPPAAGRARGGRRRAPACPAPASSSSSGRAAPGPRPFPATARRSAASDPAAPQQPQRLVGVGVVLERLGVQEHEVVGAVGEPRQHVEGAAGDEPGAVRCGRRPRERLTRPPAGSRPRRRSSSGRRRRACPAAGTGPTPLPRCRPPRPSAPRPWPPGPAARRPPRANPAAAELVAPGAGADQHVVLVDERLGVRPAGGRRCADGRPPGSMCRARAGPARTRVVPAAGSCRHPSGRDPPSGGMIPLRAGCEIGVEAVAEGTPPRAAAFTSLSRWCGTPRCGAQRRARSERIGRAVSSYAMSVPGMSLQGMSVPGQRGSRVCACGGEEGVAT